MCCRQEIPQVSLKIINRGQDREPCSAAVSHKKLRGNFFGPVTYLCYSVSGNIPRSAKFVTKRCCQHNFLHTLHKFVEEMFHQCLSTGWRKGLFKMPSTNTHAKLTTNSRDTLHTSCFYNVFARMMFAATDAKHLVRATMAVHNKYSSWMASAEQQLKFVSLNVSRTTKQ